MRLATLLLATMLIQSSGANDRLRELVETAARELPSIAAATKLLGEPLSTRISEVENRHERRIPNVKAELNFPGLTVTYLIVICCEKTVLSEVAVTDVAALQKISAVVPRTRAEAVRAYGKPSRSEGDSMVFQVANDVGSDEVTLAYEDDRLSSVRWRYWLD
jgi:hypothetical protein